MGKVILSKDIEKEIGPLREKRRFVFTNGCFDLLHIGHIRYLQEARALGDALFVGLNTDRSVRQLKGEERPIQCEDDRAEILAALSCVDFVCLFDQETPLQLIQQVQPHILVKGGDWPVDKIVGADFVMSKGGQVKTLSFVNGKSTSNIVKKVMKL